MSYCPNCGRAIQSNLPSCPECNASFGPGSAWGPVDTSPTERSYVHLERSEKSIHEGDILLARIRSAMGKLMVIDRTAAIVGTILVICLFVASLPAPAFELARREPLSGLYVLQVGWLGILMLDPRWYANILFPVLCIANVRVKRLRVTATWALGLGIGSVALPIYWYPNEGHGELVESLGIGGYSWVTAVCAVALTNLFLRPDTAPNPSLQGGPPSAAAEL